MREITHHHIGLNSNIKVFAVGDISPGGAPITYRIKGITDPHTFPEQPAYINFQNGNPVNGFNGFTHEVLLAIIIDRLQGFQKGPFAHRRNTDALNHLEEAMFSLQDRTCERVGRGVEGLQVV